MKKKLIVITAIVLIPIIYLSSNCGTNSGVDKETKLNNALHLEKKIVTTNIHINWGKDISFRGLSSLPNGTYLQTQLYEYGDIKPAVWWPADKYIQVRDGEWQIIVPLNELSENITKIYIGSETSFLFKVWEKDDPLVTDTYEFDLKGPPPIPEAER